MRRAQQQESVDVLPRDGNVCCRLPPEPVAATEVLDYLSECNFQVYAAPRGEGQPKYVFQGQVATLEKLVAIASGHRVLMDLQPFQLTHVRHEATRTTTVREVKKATRMVTSRAWGSGRQSDAKDPS